MEGRCFLLRRGRRAHEFPSRECACRISGRGGRRGQVTRRVDRCRGMSVGAPGNGLFSWTDCRQSGRDRRRLRDRDPFDRGRWRRSAGESGESAKAVPFTPSCEMGCSLAGSHVVGRRSGLLCRARRRRKRIRFPSGNQLGPTVVYVVFGEVSGLGRRPVGRSLNCEGDSWVCAHDPFSVGRQSYGAAFSEQDRRESHPFCGM